MVNGVPIGYFFIKIKYKYSLWKRWENKYI